MTDAVLALDVGGTNMRLAVVDGQGDIRGRHTIHAELARLTAEHPEEAETLLLDTLADAMRKTLRHHPEVRAVGIGFPGFFRGDSGELATSPNLPNVWNVPLAEALSERLRIRVKVQNDALMAALGEFRFGAGKGLDSLIHLTLGTGIGGGLILNGKPYTGEGGMAMEIGHMRIVTGGRPCGCGGRGCLETYASATAVAARYREETGKEVEDGHAVYRLAREGDAAAALLLHEAGDYLGRAIAEAVKLLDVHHITISGGMSAAWDRLQPPMRDAVEREVIPPLCGRIHIHRSELGDDAGLLGAASLAVS